MMDNDERLLQQFFSEAAHQQVEDNGFTERVMRQLPARQRDSIKWFNRLWTLFCITVFAVLFIVFRGWEMLAVQLETMLRTLSVQSFCVNLLMLAVILFGLLFVGVGEVISSETARR